LQAAPREGQGQGRGRAGGQCHARAAVVTAAMGGGGEMHHEEGEEDEEDEEEDGRASPAAAGGHTHSVTASKGAVLPFAQLLALVPALQCDPLTQVRYYSTTRISLNLPTYLPTRCDPLTQVRTPPCSYSTTGTRISLNLPALTYCWRR
jgi:hypothetical protein